MYIYYRRVCLCHRGNPKNCCTALIEDWITTDNGVTPKSWNKLVEVLSEVDELESATQDIKQCLINEGIVLDGEYLCMEVIKYDQRYVLGCS